jgi:hypothetical protein
MLVLQVCHPCHPYQYGKKIIQMNNQKVKMSILSQKKWNSPQTWMHILNGRLLISEMEENGVKHGLIDSGLLLMVGMTRNVLWLRHGVC